MEPIYICVKVIIGKGMGLVVIKVIDSLHIHTYVCVKKHTGGYSI